MCNRRWVLLDIRVCFLITTVHSFIFFSRLLLSSGSQGSAGAYPSCHWAKAGNPLDVLLIHRNATLRQNHSHSHSHLRTIEFPSSLTCMLLDKDVSNVLLFFFCSFVRFLLFCLYFILFDWSLAAKWSIISNHLFWHSFHFYFVK